MSEARTSEALAWIELEKLSTRIVAAERLLGSMEMTDDERGRFGSYIGRMQRRQAELLQALGPSDADEASDMNEPRLGNVEATLRHMDERLTRIVEQIHGLDNRQSRLEERIGRIEQDGQQLHEQIKLLNTPPGYSRNYLVGSALGMMLVIVLLVILTWRML